MPDSDLPIGTGWHLLPISTAGDAASGAGWRPFFEL